MEDRILVLNDMGGVQMDVSYDVTGTLRAQNHGHPPLVLIYDARGNGGGTVCPTITGDHMGHANDYMAVVVEIYEDVHGKSLR